MIQFCIDLLDVENGIDQNHLNVVQYAWCKFNYLAQGVCLRFVNQLVFDQLNLSLRLVNCALAMRLWFKSNIQLKLLHIIHENTQSQSNKLRSDRIGMFRNVPDFASFPIFVPIIMYWHIWRHVAKFNGRNFSKSWSLRLLLNYVIEWNIHLLCSLSLREFDISIMIHDLFDDMEIANHHCISITWKYLYATYSDAKTMIIVGIIYIYISYNRKTL